MPAKWQRFNITIPEEYGESEREAIADDVIAFIIERTKKGLNKSNRDMPGYSKGYIESVEFRAAGKKPGIVDLTLTGDMLGSMKLISHDTGSLVIGFEDGTFENAKADGNIRGTYGRGKSTGKKRDFLGITKSDLAKILDQYPPDSQESQDEADISGLARDGAKNVLDMETGNGE